jgi:hypothetical protein
MTVLAKALLRHAASRPTWLLEAISGRPPSERDVELTFGGVPYVVGRARLSLDDEEREAARREGMQWVLRDCTVDAFARVMLVRAIARAAGDPVSAVRRLFVTGDNDERAAVLRALPLLEAPERFIPLATEGCRTNVKTVFEAIACENPFPARHLPDAAFFQMVLKAVFVGTSLGRIESLAGRSNGELRRMARDYASERAAAGRPIPEDIHTLLEERANP